MKKNSFTSELTYADIGLVRLTSDLRIKGKNAYASKYLNLPRKGAYFKRLCHSEDDGRKLCGLSELPGSYCTVDLSDGNRIIGAILVRDKNGEVIAALHTSIAAVRALRCEYSNDALKVIAGCIIEACDSRQSGFRIPTAELDALCANRSSPSRDPVRIMPLSEAMKVMAEAVDIDLKCDLDISFGDGMCDNGKFVDIAVLTYVITEMLVTSCIFTGNGSIKIYIDTQEEYVSVKASGKYQPAKSGDNFVTPETSGKLRYLIMACALASLNVRMNLSIKSDGVFAIGATIPLVTLPLRFRATEYTCADELVGKIFRNILEFCGIVIENSEN